jgi:hypothetical protein
MLDKEGGGGGSLIFAEFAVFYDWKSLWYFTIDDCDRWIYDFQ